jgi:hypothetical protein
VEVVPRVVVAGGKGEEGSSTTPNVMEGLLTLLLSERFEALSKGTSRAPRSPEAEELRAKIRQDLEKKTGQTGTKK